MKAEKHFDRLPKEERQLIALKVATAIYEYLQLFLTPVIARRQGRCRETAQLL